MPFRTRPQGPADHIDEIARSEDVNADRVTNIVFGRSSKAHLTNETHRLHARLLKLTLERLRDVLLLDIAKPELHSVIAVRLVGLVPEHEVVAGLNDRHGNDAAFLCEDLGHAQFSS